MGLNDAEFLFRQFSGFVEYLRRHADLADVVQQSNAVILLHRFIVAAQFFGQHGGIMRHAAGMAVGVLVLHIDDFCEGFRDLPNKCHGFFMLLFQLGHPLADIEPYSDSQQQHRGQARDNIKPGLFKERLFLCLCGPALVLHEPFAQVWRR